MPSGCNQRHFPRGFSGQTIFAGHGRGEAGFYEQLTGPRSAGGIFHTQGSHPLTEISNTGLPPFLLSQRGQKMDLGSVQVGRGQLQPVLVAGGGWIPHSVLPHPPHSSAISPLVFIPASPLVRAKAAQPHTIPTETGIRKLRRGNKNQTEGYQPPQTTSCLDFHSRSPLPDQAAAQGRLSPGFAFLGKHGAPVSRKPVLLQLRIIPPAAV